MFKYHIQIEPHIKVAESQKKLNISAILGYGTSSHVEEIAEVDESEEPTKAFKGYCRTTQTDCVILRYEQTVKCLRCTATYGHGLEYR